jgi:hypothetical protein
MQRPMWGVEERRPFTHMRRSRSYSTTYAVAQKLFRTIQIYADA